MLRTRLPLGIATSFDLHVLGVPPAYVLSHDQTLKFNNGVHKLAFTNKFVKVFIKRVRHIYIFKDKYNRPRFSSLSIYVFKELNKIRENLFLKKDFLRFYYILLLYA
jgi:hypothetical protein